MQLEPGTPANPRRRSKMSELHITLGEVLNECYDWEKFCDEKGWSVYACNEGGDDIKISLTIDEAWTYGILREKTND